MAHSTSLLLHHYLLVVLDRVMQYLLEKGLATLILQAFCKMRMRMEAGHSYFVFVKC